MTSQEAAELHTTKLATLLLHTVCCCCCCCSAGRCCWLLLLAQPWCARHVPWVRVWVAQP